MASFFRKPGFSAPIVNYIMPNTGPSYSFLVLYVLVALILGVIVLMLLGVKLNVILGWLDFRSPNQKVVSQSQLFWKPSHQYTNFVSEFTSPERKFSDIAYSTTLECVLYNSRAYQNVWSDGDGPYRHIFHRGSGELLKTTVGGLLMGGCGPSGNSKDLPPYGLPSQLNPGIFLDPNVNDILVFVDTKEGARESVRIVDVPLDIPFRIGVVVDNLVLEVYINCQLEVTKILTDLPKPVENKWYGLAGSAAAQAQIQNLHIWSYPLTIPEIRPLCPPIVFAKKRPICDGADTPVPKVAEGPPQIDLGFGKAIQCPK